MDIETSHPRDRIESVSDLPFRTSFSPIFAIAGLGDFFRVELLLERLAPSPWYPTGWATACFISPSAVPARPTRSAIP